MTIPFIGDIIREVGETVREAIPDADKRLEIELQLKELADKADERETQLLLGQIEINKEEAKNSNIFVSGWRPFIGWVCGAALAWTWMLSPFLQWAFHTVTLPALPPDSIFPVVTAMLGIASMRSYEKVRGVTESWGGKVHEPVLPTQKTPQPTPTVVEKPVEGKLPATPSKRGKWFRR